MPLEDMMWVEKYRPRKLDELVDQETVRKRLAPLIEKPSELPHLLFAGPPGTGKTTVALIIARTLLGEGWEDYTLSLNASDQRGIDMVRERVKVFASYSDRRPGIPFRLVILDESDEMTREAQTALRRIMEESAKFTRFILVCNYSSGIIDPIQSRCAAFRFQRLDEKSVVECLAKIAKAEKLRVTAAGAFEAIYEATNGDLRQAINHLQAAAAEGSVTVENVKLVTGATVRGRVGEVVKLALDGDFSGARLKLAELTRVYGVPESDFLKYANEELSRSAKDNLAEALKIVAEYDYRLILGANPEIQIAAMLAELSALKGAKGRD